MSAELKITLVKSPIGKPASQRAIIAGLGLKRLNKTVILMDTPEIRGMVRKVSHMVTVDE